MRRRLKFQAFFDTATAARRERLEAVRSADEWSRFVSCNPLPYPENDRHVNGFLAAEANSSPENVTEALSRMHSAATIIQEIEHVSIRLNQAGADISTLNKYKAKLYNLISSISDKVTAWFLHHSDYFSDSEGGVKHEEIVSSCRWGLWLNINKNPRLKLLEFPILQCSVEIVKQLALAPVAIRAQLLPTSDDHNSVCTNELVAVGPAMMFELLTLPPPSKSSVNQWILRMHTPLTHSINKIPYPIPPAGADPNTWVADDDVQALAITVKGVPPIVQLGDDPLQVRLCMLCFTYNVKQLGACSDLSMEFYRPWTWHCAQVAMWNEKQSAWDTSKIKNVEVVDDSLTFRAMGLGSFAVVYDRCGLLPYHAWNIRPAAGEGGNVALLSIDVGMDGMPVEIEVGPGHATLKGPKLRPLVPLLGVAHQPLELLRALKDLGVCLLPTSEDAERVDVEEKELAVEQSMCEGVAMLAGSHIIASSKWTQYVGVRHEI